MKGSDQWQCSVQILNQTAYRKFQHASMYNPTKTTNFTIQKRVQKQNFDPLFKNKKKYKLPEISSNLNRAKALLSSSMHKKPNFKIPISDKSNLENKAKNMKNILNAYSSKNKNLQKKSTQKLINATYDKRQDKIKTSRQKRYQECIKTFKNNVLKIFNQFSQKDQHFSYIFNIVQLLHGKIQATQDKNLLLSQILEDFQLLSVFFYGEMRKTIHSQYKSIISHDSCELKQKREQMERQIMQYLQQSKKISTQALIRSMTQFKKESKHLQIKTPFIRILFHLFLAELEFYQNNLSKSLSQFQFCEYYCRKQEGLETLILCFLWQIFSINIFLFKYEQADTNLRNLLEMAVVCKNKSSIKYIMQKISLIYYYRGNSIMGQYYLKKAEEGLTSFEIQMYFKQYNNNDEIKRLEKILFNCPVQQLPMLKRKNNPKLQSDIWRESKEDFEINLSNYMDRINQMLKDHQNAEEGRKIKNIVKKVNFIGHFKKIDEKKINESKQDRIAMYQTEQQKTSEQNEGWSISKFRKQQEKRKELTKFYENAQENVTKIIKTHLSQNRQNKSHNLNKMREQRWRNFVKFFISAEHQLRYIKLQLSKAEQKNYL